MPVRTTAIVVTAGEPRPVSRNRRITTMIASCRGRGGVKNRMRETLWRLLYARM